MRVSNDCWISGAVKTYLERVLSREALVAVSAWERLDGQMDSLVSFQVVVAVEALWALIALEGSVVGCWTWTISMHVLHLRRVSTVIARYHSCRHTANQGKLVVWVVDVRENGSGKRI